MFRKILLACGIASSVLYAAMTLLIAWAWPGYRSASQTISELSAVGAPTRWLWLLPGGIYTVLVTAFGVGVWRSAGRSRALRAAGGAIVAYGALGLLWPFAPMHQREVLAAGGATTSDTLHLVLASVSVLLMFGAMVFAAVARGRRFRIYSAASIVGLLVFGALTFVEAPAVGANLATPWIGVWERINIGVFLVWIAALAAALWRTLSAASADIANGWQHDHGVSGRVTASRTPAPATAPNTGLPSSGGNCGRSASWSGV
jgi:hypothetical protein